jgi:hypothetical protein
MTGGNVMYGTAASAEKDLDAIIADAHGVEDSALLRKVSTIVEITFGIFKTKGYWTPMTELE